MTATELQTKKPGPNIWLSILIFSIGAVLTTVGVSMLLSSLLGAITEDAFPIPGVEERTFPAGDYDVFVSSGSLFAPLDDVSASTADVTITNVDSGENLAVAPLEIDLSINRGQTAFAAIATFEVTEPGTYQVAVLSDVGGLALVSKAIPGSFAEVRTQVIMMVVGVILGLIGAAMVVFGMVRRSTAKREAKQRAQREQGIVPGQFQVPGQVQPTQAPPTPGQPAPPAPNQAPTSGSDSATPWDS